MKKFWLLTLSLLVLCVSLSACTDPNDSGSEKSTVSTTQATAPPVIGIGGEGDWDFSRHYILDFSIGSSISDLVDSEDYQAWCNTFEHYDNGGMRNKYEHNLYTLIHEFSIPREQIEKACEDYKKQFPEDEYLTKEQLDMLYNGTEIEVYQYFANPYAVMVGKDAYPPKWMVQHTAQEYLEAGITYEILSSELEDLLKPCTEDQKIYICEQWELLRELEQ